VEESEIYSAIGREGFERLVAAFYGQVPDDDILGRMYPGEDLHGAERRLRDFLIFRFGGPATYVDQRGHPRLRMRHARFDIDNAARTRWLKLMNHALESARLPAEPAQLLSAFFESMATFLINRVDAGADGAHGPGMLL
jgi:hemoglobin